MLPVVLCICLGIFAAAVLVAMAGGTSRTRRLGLRFAALDRVLASQDAGGSAAVGGPSGGRHRMAEALMGLGLSDAQKAQVRDIMSAARKQSAGADQATRRANFQAAMAKIDTILTPDQRTKLHAKLDQMRNERQQSSSPPPS